MNLDNQYLKLAQQYEAGDKSVEKQLQQMVDKMAKKAGYTIGPVYRRSHHNIQSELESKRAGIFWSSDTKYTENFGGRDGVKSSAYLKIDYPYFADAEEIEHLHIHRHELTTIFKKYDGIIERNTENTEIAEIGEEHQFIIRNAYQSKSSNIITNDLQGNIIPLSKRFNQQSTNIKENVFYKLYESLQH
jgi:hypothetical protein